MNHVLDKPFIHFRLQVVYHFCQTTRLKILHEDPVFLLVNECLIIAHNVCMLATKHQCDFVPYMLLVLLPFGIEHIL